MKKLLLLLTLSLMALSNAFGAVTWWLQEDFESGQIPATWTQEVVSSNVANWVIEPTSAATYPASGNSSNYYVALRNTTGRDQHYVTKLITPAINFTQGEARNPQLVFNHAQVGYSTDFDTLKVYYRANANASWTLLRVFDTRIDVWTEDTIALPGFSGATGYQVAFEANENLARGIVLDDVRIYNASACVNPSGLEVIVPGTTKVTLAWAGDTGLGADTFEVVVSKFAIVDWSSYQAAFHGYSTDYSYSIQATGLEHSTDYYAYVRSKCYDNESGWTEWAMGTFRTRSRIELPYSQAFLTNELPQGWWRFSNGTSTQPTFLEGITYSLDSTFALAFDGVAAGKRAMAILPEVNVPSLHGVELSFWGTAGTNVEMSSNSSVARMYIGVMNDPELTESLVIVDTVEIQVSNKHQHFNVSFDNYNGEGLCIALVAGDAERSSYFYVDNISITQPAVIAPTDVRVVNITPQGFDVKVKQHGASQWNLRIASVANYRHEGALPSSFLVSQDGISTDTYHVSGNYGNQILCVYAQAASAGSTSIWTFPLTVRIPAQATLPLSYEFDSIQLSLPLTALDNELTTTSTAATFDGLYFPLKDYTSYYPKVVSSAPKYNNTSHVVLQGIGQWMTLPYIESFAGQMVAFKLAASNEGQSRVAVGVMEDPYDASTFTQLAVFSGMPNSYMNCEVDLDGKDALGHYIAIRAIEPANPGAYGSTNHIDALHVEAMPACREASFIEAIVGDTTVSLAWESRGMNHWYVELFAADGTTLLDAQDVSTPSASFSGLRGVTDYYYQVSTICGTDTLSGIGKVKFQTLCSIVRHYPWMEDFDNLPAGVINHPCWENEHVEGSATSLFQVESATLKLPDMQTGNITRLYMPEMVLPGNDYEFVFDVKRTNTYMGKTEEGIRIILFDGTNEIDLGLIARVDTVATTIVPKEAAAGWYTYSVPLNISGACRLILQGESYYGAATYMDNLKVRKIPTCFEPTDLAVSHTTDSSAVITWTPSGNERQWQYLCVPSDYSLDLDWSQAALVSTPSATILGLTSTTSYKAYVRAYCSASDQSDPSFVSFRTDCGAIAEFPWNEGFEDYQGGTYNSTDQNLIPACWSCYTIPNSSTSTKVAPHVIVNSSSYAYIHSGTKALTFYGNGQNYALLPRFSSPLNTLKISFWYATESSSNGELKLGYFDSTDTIFHPIATYSTTSGHEFVQIEKILTALPATADRLAFQWSYSGQWSCCVDDIQITQLDLNCTGLGNLRVAVGSASDASIFWTAGGTQSVDIEISETDSFAVVEQHLGVTDNPYVLNQLESNHRYYIRARQTCDTEGEWLTTFFKTMCTSRTPEELGIQRFENTDEIDCWSVGVSNLGTKVTADPDVASTSTLGHYLHFKKLANPSDTVTYGDGMYAIMPELNIDSINHYDVVFNAFKLTNVATNVGKLTVGVITDPSDFSTFTDIQALRLDYAADSLAEKTYTVSFKDYVGDFNGDFGKYVMFLAQSADSANEVGIDNIEISAVNNCPQIVEGRISDIEQNSALYRWEGNGAAAYEVVVMTSAGNPDASEELPVFHDTVTVDSVHITGLSAMTVYYAYVRVLCGDEASRWSAHSAFRTSCGEYNLPWIEGFEGMEIGGQTSPAPDCWEIINANNGAYPYIYVNNSSSYVHSGSKSLYFKSSSSIAGYAVMPRFVAPLNTLQIEFSHKEESATSSGILSLGYMTDIADTNTFVLLDEYTRSTSWQTEELRLDVIPENVANTAYLVFRYSPASQNYYMGIDDITVSRITNCKPLVSIMTTNVERRSISLKLMPKPGQNPSQYDLVYSTTQLNEAVLDTIAKISVDPTGMYTISNLTRNTLYHIYARVNCGDDGVSDWISIDVKTLGLVGEEVIYIAEGTSTSSYAPVYGLWTDHPQKVQSIYPASLLTQLIGKPISKLTYYMSGASTKSGGSWRTGMGSFQVGVAIVDQETATTSYVNAPLLNIHTGSLDASGTEMTIELATPLVYTGGNLLVDFTLPVATIYESASFYGMTQTGGSCYAYDHTTKNPTVANFLPMIGCTYAFNLDACPTVSDMNVELLGDGTSEAMLTWTASDGDFLSGYDVIISDSVVAQPDSAALSYANIQGDSLLLTGLNAETTYHVYVRAICQAEGNDDGMSTWAELSFATLANCPAVVNLNSELTGANKIAVSWIPAFADQALNFAYVYSTDSLSAADLAAAEKSLVNDTLAFVLSELAYDQTYYIYVASVCGESFSPWSRTVIKTDMSCAPVRNLAVERVEHNRVILTWNRSRFGSETQWEAGIVGDSTSVVIVSDTAATVSTMLIGLEPDSSYVAYVKAMCAEGEVSQITTVPFRTSVYDGCHTVGEGTSDDNLAPFNNFYKNAWTQMIYTADEIGGNGAINSIWYNCAAVGTALTQDVKIYMGHTALTVATSSDWVPQEELTLVYANTTFAHPTSTGWVQILLDTPFDYNGSDNLAVVVSTHADSYVSALHYAYTAGASGVTLYRRSDSDATCGEYPTATGTTSTNKPDMQFCFDSDVTCLPVTNMSIKDVTTNSAVASWEPMGGEREWRVFVADTILNYFGGLTFDTVYTYTYPIADLLPDKNYWFYVQPLCGGEWRAVKFTTVATCSAPIDLSVDTVGYNFAVISWTDAFSVGSSYTVAYGLADSFNLADPTTYQTIVAPADSVVLTGLSGTTDYSVAVKANCAPGVESRFSEIISFTTECAPETVPWYDGFEGSVACWLAGNMQSNTSTYFPELVSTASYVHSGNKALKLYAYASSSVNADSAFVIVPEIDFDTLGLHGTVMRFYGLGYAGTVTTTSYYHHVLVGMISNADISTFELVEDVALSTVYEEYEVSFAHYNGNGNRIAMISVVDPSSSATTRYGQIYIDDVSVVEAPSCSRPAAVSVLSFGTDSASFSWERGGNETQWQYLCIPAAETPDWRNAVLTSDTVATVINLSPATPYVVYVRSYCSADDQSGYRTAEFTTLCGIITALPWTEGFEHMDVGTTTSAAPMCWDLLNANDGNYPYIYVNNSSNYVHSGSKSLYFRSSKSRNGYAILPPFALALNSMRITFSHKYENVSSSGILDLGYITDVTDTASFVSIAQFTRATAWQTEVLRLDTMGLDSVPANARLAFRYGPANQNYYLGIDDIKIEEFNLNCLGVNNLRLGDFTASSAVVEWGYISGINNAEVQVATNAAFTDIVDTYSVTNASSYMLTGLQLATTYYVRVRQACGDGDFSEWCEPIFFSTASQVLPYIPTFGETAPTDWFFSNTKAADVFNGTPMASYTSSGYSGWQMEQPDSVINAYHFLGDIYSTWAYWAVTPAIDMTTSNGQGVILSVDLALDDWSSAHTPAPADLTGVDDRFLIAVSEDGGATWNAADVAAEWNNTGSEYVYNDIPMYGTTYRIDLSRYVGKVVKIGFYGESTVSNADNDFHFGKIRVEAVEATTYVDTICEGYSFNEHGFNIPYEDLQIGLNTFTRYESLPDGSMALTIQHILVNAASVFEIPVTLCEGEHYNGYGFDVTVTRSENIRHRVDGGNQFGCDSTAILQITMLPTIREEIHVGCNEDSYTWKGKTYYQSTIVSDTATSAVTGCDSITTLYLTMCDNVTYNYHGAFCAGGSYSDEFFENITAPGQYSTTAISEIGCETYANLTLHMLAQNQAYEDSVDIRDLPYVLGNDTLCPETDQAGFVYHGQKDFGCGMVSVTIKVYDKTALTNVSAASLQVAPNPVLVGEDIRILTDIDVLSDYSCRVFDAVGKLVYESFEPSKTIPGLPTAGMYTVRIASGSTIYQGKLIVK